MSANTQAYTDHAQAKSAAGSLGIAADPPLTVKITDMLDEAQKRLHSAAAELSNLSGRLFGEPTGCGSASASEQPTDFNGMISERLHYLIGLAGDINGAATRLANRL